MTTQLKPCPRPQFLLDGCLDPQLTNDLLAQALWRDFQGGRCPTWYGARPAGRVAPMTDLGRRLLGLHILSATRPSYQPSPVERLLLGEHLFTAAPKESRS